MQKYYVTSFYRFHRLTQIENVKSDILAEAQRADWRGLLILAEEGFNSTMSTTSEEAREGLKNWFRSYFQTPDITFKDSLSEQKLFRRFSLKIRPEIVTLKTPNHFPDQPKNQHLTPGEWNAVLKGSDDYLLIDTRNWYEYQLGTFKGAINPDIDVFTEFPQYVEKHNLPKDKKMLIFCTGGIRCEKGIMELQARGYDQVFQLEGGILKYLEEFPEDQFQGECFVFDQRVALDQKLHPTLKYKLCPHCGQPGDRPVQCLRCDHETLICHDCQKLEGKAATCSKHCAYQWGLHPGRKGPRQEPVATP